MIDVPDASSIPFTPPIGQNAQLDNSTVETEDIESSFSRLSTRSEAQNYWALARQCLELKERLEMLERAFVEALSNRASLSRADEEELGFLGYPEGLPENTRPAKLKRVASSAFPHPPFDDESTED